MINSVLFEIFTFTFISKTSYKELKIAYSIFYEQTHLNHDNYLNKKLDMYKIMIIVVEKDMTTRNYAKSYADINLEKNTKIQFVSIENEGDMKKLQKVKRHLLLVLKRGNIEREIKYMKMLVLKSCLKKLEM